MAINNYFDPVKEGAIKFNPQQQGASPAAPEDAITGLPKTLLDVSQGASDIARGAGLGAAPDLLAMSPAMQAVQKLTGVNPAMTSQERSQFKTPGDVAARGAQDIAGAASWMMPAGAISKGAKAAVPALSKGIPGLLTSLLGYGATGAARGELYGLSQGQSPQDALGYAGAGAIAEPLAGGLGAFGTKGGVAKRTMTAAEQSKNTIPFDTLKAQITKKVTDKYGSTPEVTQALNDILAEKTPAGVEAAPDTLNMSPAKQLEWRRQILGREGGGILQAFTGKNIQDKVAGEVRSALSSSIHQLAPGTANLDKLYTIYSKLHGDVPTQFKRILGGYIADKIFGKSLGGLPREAVDALGVVFANAL